MKAYINPLSPGLLDTGIYSYHLKSQTHSYFRAFSDLLSSGSLGPPLLPG